MGDRRLGEAKKRHQFADADLPGVPSKDVDELHPNRVAQRFRNAGHPFGLLPLDVGVGDGVAADLALGTLLLRCELQGMRIDVDQYTSIDIYQWSNLEAMAAKVPEVLFVCVHNAGRSQMAAGLLNRLAAGRVHVRTAGSAPAEEINPAAIEAMAELGIDLSHEVPKRLTDEFVREADVVITMGCGDACPIYPGKRYEDWVLDDPAGQDIETVRRIRADIEVRVKRLLAELPAVPDNA